ncbi:MAG: hypothetical protein HY308_08505 [Gammaproteobacteria bacterium]|nr:hypothetical protein [Gammaproteobacteria bacterium]
MNFLVMSWAVFAVGAGMLLFFVFKRIQGATAPQITAMLFPPIILMLAALFAPNLTALKVSAEGFQFDLGVAKAAAAEAVEKEPAIAEAVTAKKGQEAVTSAREQIMAAKNWEDLRQVMPFERKDGTIVFYPRADVPVEVKPIENGAVGDRFSVNIKATDPNWRRRLTAKSAARQPASATPSYP